jgi:tetratricopeptide (TPR) repeat protein/predicted aspartyl protease
MSFSISGAGDRQPNLENYFQSIDRIRIMDGQKLQSETPMEGECHFHMNERATVFYFIHCDVYNRRKGVMFNFHLDNISSFDRKVFDSSGQPRNTPTPESNSVSELHLCTNASSPSDKIAHCTNVISRRVSERALVTARNTRGLALMDVGRYRDAIDDFSFVIAHEPKVAGYYDNRQNAYRQSGMLEEALKDADRAVDLAPQYSFVFRGRANVYNDMAKYDLALENYDQAIKLAPDDGGLFIERGKILRAQSKFDQAISDFSQALELDTKKWMAGYRERGITYKLLGQNQNAVADLTTYNSIAPGDQEVVFALATLETAPELGPSPQPTASPDSRASVSVTQPTTAIIPMVPDGGTFRVPVTINGQLTLKFVIDSGASDVSIPADVVMTLVRTETITDGDFLGKQTYTLADGSTVPSQRFVIRSLKVGDRVLENVTGSIAPVAGSLLLGQSFLSRFKSWSIDNQRQALILE